MYGCGYSLEDEVYNEWRDFIIYYIIYLLQAVKEKFITNKPKNSSQ